jgi:hypothetical protein
MYNNPLATPPVHAADDCSRALCSQDTIFVFIYPLKGRNKWESGLQENLHKLKFTQVKNMCSYYWPLWFSLSGQYTS